MIEFQGFALLIGMILGLFGLAMIVFGSLLDYFVAEENPNDLTRQSGQASVLGLLYIGGGIVFFTGLLIGPELASPNSAMGFVGVLLNILLFVAFFKIASGFTGD